MSNYFSDRELGPRPVSDASWKFYANHGAKDPAAAAAEVLTRGGGENRWNSLYLVMVTDSSVDPITHA